MLSMASGKIPTPSHSRRDRRLSPDPREPFADIAAIMMCILFAPDAYPTFGWTFTFC